VATCSRLTGKGADEAVALYGAKQHLVYDARIVLPACTPAVSPGIRGLTQTAAASYLERVTSLFANPSAYVCLRQLMTKLAVPL